MLVECIDAVVTQLSAKAEAAGGALVGPVEDAIRAARETTAQDLRRRQPVPARNDELRDLVIAFSLDAAAAEILVRVDDDGPGLGPDPEALFAPFRRGTSERADSVSRGAGVGLGLAIARRVAVAHGGSLTAGPSPIGGARFTLALPWKPLG